MWKRHTTHSRKRHNYVPGSNHCTSTSHYPITTGCEETSTVMFLSPHECHHSWSPIQIQLNAMLLWLPRLIYYIYWKTNLISCGRLTRHHSQMWPASVSRTYRSHTAHHSHSSLPLLEPILQYQLLYEIILCILTVTFGHVLIPFCTELKWEVLNTCLEQIWV